MRTLGAALLGVAVVILFPELPLWRLFTGDVLLILASNAFLDDRRSR